MIAHAKWHFARMEAVGTGGATVADHVAAARRQRGKKAKVDRPPPLPWVAQGAWVAFVDLSSARQIGFGMPQPVAYSEILAYQEATSIRLLPWEVDLIRRVDAEYMAASAEQARRRAPPK